MPHLMFLVILPLLLSILYQSVGRFQVFISSHLIFTVILPLLLNTLQIPFVNGIIEMLKSDNEKMLHKFNAFSYDIAMSCLSNLLTTGFCLGLNF